MVYLDTNVLIYASFNQDQRKQDASQRIIAKLRDDCALMVSPLVLQEFVFTCAKLNMERRIVANHYTFYRSFSSCSIDQEAVDDAFALSQTLNCGKNINDAVHLKLAERHCSTLMTFDKDFMRFIPHSSVRIEIL